MNDESNQEQEAQSSLPNMEEFNAAASAFGKEMAETVIKYKDVLPLSYMAKSLLALHVDLLVNQQAIQAQHVVQEMLAPLFENMKAQAESQEARSQILRA